jgi:hypothetical protein
MMVLGCFRCFRQDLCGECFIRKCASKHNGCHGSGWLLSILLHGLLGFMDNGPRRRYHGLVLVLLRVSVMERLWQVLVYAQLLEQFFSCSSGTDSTCIKRSVQKFKYWLSLYRRTKTLCGSACEIPVRVQPAEFDGLSKSGVLVLVVGVSFSDCLNSVLGCRTNNLGAERARLFCPLPSTTEFLCPLSNTFPSRLRPSTLAWNPRLVGRVELGTSATPQKSQPCALGLGFPNQRVVLLQGVPTGTERLLGATNLATSRSTRVARNKYE